MIRSIIQPVLHYCIHHWSLILVGAFIVYAILGTIYEMLFNHGPLDHEDETWGHD